MCFQAWRSHNQGQNNVAACVDHEGVYVTPSSKAFCDEEGKNFWVEIEIVDRHRIPSGSQGPYNVMTSLLVPGNYQGEKMIKWNKVFDKPGTYMINLPTVGVKTTGTMVVEMTDKNGLHFSDEFSLTFHLHYYKILKWLLVLPMMLCWLSFVHRNPCLCHLSRATQSCERDNKIRLIGCSHN